MEWDAGITQRQQSAAGILASPLHCIVKMLHLVRKQTLRPETLASTNSEQASFHPGTDEIPATSQGGERSYRPLRLLH